MKTLLKLKSAANACRMVSPKGDRRAEWNGSKNWAAMSAKAVAGGGLLASAGPAQAGFVAIDNDQVLDTSTNLIWLQEPSYTA